MIPLATLSPGVVTLLATLITAGFGYLAVRSNAQFKKLENAAAADREKAAANAAAQKLEVETAASRRGQDLEAQNKSYAALQADVEGLRDEMAAQKKAHADEMTEVRQRLARSEKRERILVDYTLQLRRDIELQVGPPPKPWPKELDET